MNLFRRMNLRRLTIDPAAVRRQIARLLVAAGLASGLGVAADAQDAPRTTFDDNVKTVLRQHCSACHGPDKKNGSLDVTSFTTLMMGGSSGTVIEPGDADGSYLYSLVTHEDEPVMPPEGKLSDAELAIIKKWIDDGAPENAGSKVSIKKKPAMSVTTDPQVRPEFVANWPRLPLEPVQHTPREPVTRSIATSPWTSVAAVAGQNQVLLYDTASLNLKGVLPFPEGVVNVVRFSRNGAVLLAAGGMPGNRGVAVLWDVASGERIGVFGDELDAVIAADISPDHSRVALGGSQKLVNVYSTRTGELEYSLDKHTDWVTTLEFSVDGVLLASGDRNGGLYVFEAFTGREYLTLKGHEQTINDISWRNDSNVVASASDDTTIRLWEMNNGGQIKSWNAHAGGTTALEFLRDGQLVSTGDDRITRLWQPDGKQVLEFPPLDEIGLAVAWCNETGRAISGDYLGQVRVWNGADAALLGSLTPNPPTLQQRIDAAREQVAKYQADLQPLQQELAAVTDQAAQAAATLDAANQELAVATQTLNELQTSMATASEKKSQAQSMIDSLQASLDSRSTARTLVAESLSKLREAIERVPDDPALATQIEALAQRVVGFETEIASLQTELTTAQQMSQDSGSQVVAANEQLVPQQTLVDNATVAVQQATAALQPLTSRRDELNAQVSAMQASLVSVENDVQRWTGEIAFVQQLAELDQRMIAAQDQVQQQQAKLDAANQKLAEARAAADAVQADVEQASQAVQQIQVEIDTVRQIK